MSRIRIVGVHVLPFHIALAVPYFQISPPQSARVAEQVRLYSPVVNSLPAVDTRVGRTLSSGESEVRRRYNVDGDAIWYGTIWPSSPVGPGRNMKASKK